MRRALAAGCAVALLAPGTAHAKSGLELYGDIAQLAIPGLAGVSCL
jgi:hypothetical protein